MTNTPPAPQPPSPARDIGNPFSYLRGRRANGNQQQQQQQQQGSGAQGASASANPPAGTAAPGALAGAPPQNANNHPGGSAPVPSIQLATTTSPGPISPVSTASHHHVHLPHLLHRRHSSTAPSPPSLSPHTSTHSNNSANATPQAAATPTAANPGAMAIGIPHGPSGTQGNPHRLRLVPHLESSRSLIFDPILRQLLDGQPPIRIGRFTERRSGHGGRDDDGKIAFRSKVVSRGHAEVWCEPGGKVLLRDTSSSSGTFLNHIRLSSPNVESRPYPLKDGDVIQLGVDYQGGTEEIYRCVKIRVELDRHVGGREAFNENALAQLSALAAMPAIAATVAAEAPATIASAMGDGQAPGTKKASITECSICISSVTVCQALFIAPCSHVFHYKCIRPLVEKRYPGFMCPMCRCYADLDADVD
ncbi:SMAD/FHA domain-containing protein, partial [Calocera viscosa TUFC12733]